MHDGISAAKQQGDAMDASTPLAQLLRRYMHERNVSLERLARESSVRKTTIHHWLAGDVGKPYYLEGLLRVAAALKLNRARASRLLQAAGHPPLGALLTTAMRDEQRILTAPWSVTTRNNLPIQLTSFIGREDELLDIADLLSQPDVRLVTLIGAGGSGKTRLALAVAAELHDVFTDGIFFVSLASITEPAQAIPAIARTLDLRDAPGEPTARRLAEYVDARRILLVLDNFEQLTGAGPTITDLLRATQHLTMLVTSRRRLHVSGEHEWVVVPFPAPPDCAPLSVLAANPAVMLFAARAKAANQRFALSRHNAAAVAEICARLDGLPLGIELAAARVRQFTPKDLLEQFSNRLELSADGPLDVPRRQQSLRETIAWSVHLLNEDERRLFARLAVFAGGWQAEAAVAICDAPDEDQPLDVPAILAVLRAGHLVQRHGDSTPAGVESERYSMLETIREYALERLTESGEDETICQRHAAHFLAFAESAGPYIPQTWPGPWFDQAATEYDNLRAALGWALDRQDRELAVRLAGALWPYWHEHGRFDEGQRWLDAALDLPASDEPAPQPRARALTGSMILSLSRADFLRAGRHGEEALALWRALDDQLGMALVLLYQALLHQHAGDLVAAATPLLESADHWRAYGDPRGIGLGLNELAFLRLASGDPEGAETLYVEAFTLYRQAGDDIGMLRARLDNGMAALFREDYEHAIPTLREGLLIARRLPPNWMLSAVLFYLGVSLCFSNELEPAVEHLAESLRLRYDAGERLGVFYCLLGFAMVASRRNEAERAARLCGAAWALQQTLHAPMVLGTERIYEREIKAVRDQIDETTFNSRFEAGTRMSMAEAVHYALEAVNSPEPLTISDR